LVFFRVHTGERIDPGLRRQAPRIPDFEGVHVGAIDHAKALLLLTHCNIPYIKKMQPVYGWFTEGFGTADLKEVKALLDALP
jgi:hypothetical protein